MEIVLNISWALCSFGLIWLWVRGSASNPVPRRTQILALAMVVLLLLPVISLSDDLMAMQSPAETDSCLRRALHASDAHPLAAPASFALPEESVDGLTLSGFSQEFAQNNQLRSLPSPLIHSLDTRPPPQS